MTRHSIVRLSAVPLLVCGFAHVGRGAESALPFDPPAIDPPTLHCIGVQWSVESRRASNATVKVEYRRTADAAWRRGLDLFRVFMPATYGIKTAPGAQLFAGSLFDLQEDTPYQVRLTFEQPDRVVTTRLIEAQTWKEPQPPPPRRVRHVSSASRHGPGTESQPFATVLEADQAAQPGDLILVHKGIYPGPIRFTRSGTDAAPIVWRGAGDGEAVFEGPENGCCVRADGLTHVFFEDLAFRKTDRAMTLNESSFVTVRRCRLYDLNSGIFAAGRQERLFIADCEIKGRRTWPRQPTDDKMGEHRGIEVSGVGHVIAYNRVSGFRDGIDTRPAFPVRGIDIHNNDISECTDDAIELDYSQSNCRAYRNRFSNCFMGVSFQPSLGGPNYAVRNVMYNIVLETYKLHVSPPGVITAGGVLLHNTVVKKDVPFRVWASGTPVRAFYMRNNLYVAGGAQRAIDMLVDEGLSEMDYDVYAGGPYEIFGKWHGVPYPELAAFTRATGLESHGQLIRRATGIFAAPIAAPTDSAKAYPAGTQDLRLSDGGPAVDAGVALPNINDGYHGKTPDAGAYELGEDLPQYGPRVEGKGL